MTTGERMKERRKELGLSAEYVANRLGVSPATIYRYEKGDIEKMPGNILEPISKILRTTPACLMGWEDAPAPIEIVPPPAREIDEIYETLNHAGQTELCSYGRYLVSQDQYKANEPPKRDAPTKIIPLLGASFAAGVPEYPGDLFMSDYKTTDLRAEFAIRVNGNSMEPWLPDGSIALGVKRFPRDGEVGAFWLDGGFLVKQVAVDILGTVYLFALNRDRSDADEEIRSDSGRDLRPIGTIILDARIPLP